MKILNNKNSPLFSIIQKNINDKKEGNNSFCECNINNKEDLIIIMKIKKIIKRF